MGDNIKDTEETKRPRPPISAQGVAIQEVDDAVTRKRTRIRPRKVLESLGHLRIEKTRIKPLESKAPTAGGKADVEPAILVPEASPSLRESDDEEYVAVKKLRFDTNTNDDQVLAPFAHEISLLNELANENVVKIIGFVEDAREGIAWMVFSWEKNGNLREFVRSANWELPERVSLITDVAMGLRYLHERNPPICHGDLKSLNILVNSGSRAIITDFGSARAVDSLAEVAVKSVNAAAATEFLDRITTKVATKEPLKAEVSASGDFITVTGPAWTIRWAAPELLEGKVPGLASDIWAFGWICWEAVTGNFPFAEENDVTIVQRITRGDLPAIGDNAQLKQIKVLCNLMGECWGLDVNERPTALRCEQVISFMDHTAPSSCERNSPATNHSSRLLYALGKIQMRNDMMTEARKYFRESFLVARAVGDEWAQARASRAFGNTCYLQDEYSKAEDSYIEALEICSQIGDQLGFADSVRGLGDVYRMRSEYPKAEDSYTQAREIYSQIGDQLGFAHSVKGMGDVYLMRDKYSKAEASFVQARDIYSSIGDQLGFAQSVKGLGNVYRMRNEYSEAEDSYIQAREIYSQIGDQLGIAQSVNGLGDVYLMRNEYSKAEDSYTQAREIYSQIGDQLGFAQSVKGLGDVYRMRDEHSKAEDSYTLTREIYSQIGDQAGFAHSVQGLGRIYSAQGEYGKAEETYLDAQTIYRRIEDTQAQANILWHLGWNRRRQAQYGEAACLVEEASTLYGTLGLTKDVAECGDFLKEVHQLMTSSPSLHLAPL